MPSLEDFDQSYILRWWAEHSSVGQQDLQYVAQQAETYLVDPKDLALPALRRYIRWLLYRHNLLPDDRAPLKSDYQDAKERIKQDWIDQDIT